MENKFISEVQWRQIRKKVNLDFQNMIEKAGSSCDECNKNYCCIHQRHIEVFDIEFDAIKYYITEEHIANAREEMKRKDGFISCPFNNKKTGLCDIYENRFQICSSQGVTSPIEDCNSISNPDGGTMTFDRNHMIGKLKEDSLLYISTLAKTGKAYDIIKQFERVYGKGEPNEN